MGFFKLLPFIWPFVKELILGDKTMIEAFKTNKKKVMLVAVIMFSFALNIFLVPKLVAISSAHVVLQREHEELQALYLKQEKTSPIKGGKAVAGLEDPPRATAPQEETPQPVSTSKIAHSSTQAQKDARVEAMRKHFDEIRSQEERE